MGTDDAPGNAGIFDMIEALRWVKKFIGNFGGDPEKVTIAGESAGSEAITILLLAPQARGISYDQKNILKEHILYIIGLQYYYLTTFQYKRTLSRGHCSKYDGFAAVCLHLYRRG